MTSQKDKVDEKSMYSVPAVDAMLNAVEYMSKNCAPIGVSELARRTNISINLAFRVMKKLLDRGYVQADSSMEYSLTPKWMSLGALIANNFNMYRVAHSYLENLSMKLGFTSMLQTLENGEMLVRDCVAPFRSLYVQIVAGSVFSVHANAYAKAILANMRGTKKYSDEIAKLKAKKINIPAFERELEQVAATGIAYDWEEHTKGIFCMAAPVFSTSSTPDGAIGISGLISLKPSDNAKLSATILDCAKRMSSELGGIPNSNK